jgi:hypothetical protein
MPTLIKRLTLDMTADEHRQIKTLASFYGVTMKDFLLSKAIDGAGVKRPIKVAGVTDETVYLLRSARNKKRLLKSLKVSSGGRKKFGSINELKNALGI